jgi:hypothetical protein
MLEWLVPFAAYLKVIRDLLAHGWGSALWPSIALLLGQSIAFYALGFWALGRSFEVARRRGAPLIFPT